MKLWELDWKAGSVYRASNGQILEVDLMGNLVDYSLNPISISHKTLCFMDFEPYVDWSSVEVDTKVWVSEDRIVWHKRHFAKYEDDKVYCFAKGTTSWSNGGEMSVWTYAKLL